MGGVLALAAVLRVWGMLHDLPFSFYGDEMHFIKRSMAMGTGDLNPHWFHKPAFLMYVLCFLYGVYFTGGYLIGAFDSVDAFAAHFLHNQMPFLLIGRGLVVACGVATVYVVYRLAKRVFDSDRAGYAAAVVAAILPPMISSSQEVKADVPCGLLLTMSLYWYLKAWQTKETRPLVIAALLAGVATGTKYYGVILLGPYGLAELARRFTDKVEWKTVFARGSLVLMMWIVGFFVVSPYNFLDPMFGEHVAERVAQAVGIDDKPRYDPDSEKIVEAGGKSIAAATVHFAGRFARSDAVGPVYAILAIIGLIAAVAVQRTRAVALILGGVLLVYVALAVVMAPFHFSGRHGNAVYPLVCVFVWPGLLAVQRLVRVPAGRHALVGAFALGVCATVTLAQDVQLNVDRMRVDSRVTSYHWICDNVDPSARILLDNYGPLLDMNARAADRMEERVERLGLGGDSFSRHEETRLRLVREFPAEHGFDVQELGHPWWSRRELTSEELLTSAKHLDMGSPLVDRLPKSVREYAAEGYTHIVTNSNARGRYFFGDTPKNDRFPTWVAFYRELDGLEPVKTFDPKDWGGKGPVVRVYELPGVRK